MKSADRKFLYMFAVIGAVIAVEIAWFLLIGPTDHRPDYTSTCSENCDVPWWASTAAWTCLFTFVLTISTALMWWETRRLASGGEEHAAKMERSIAEAAKAAGAMKNVADGMARAASAMSDVAYQATLSNIQNRENTQTQFRQMGQYIAAAQTTADAAKLSANAALAQLQPRVAIGARGLQKHADGRLIAWSNTTNTGGSTAYKLQILTGIQFLDHPLESAMPQGDGPPPYSRGNGWLARGKIRSLYPRDGSLRHRI